jgi:RNA polymerase-binding transcription factor DksA
MRKASFGSIVPEAADVRGAMRLEDIREKLLKSRSDILTIATKVHKQTGLREASLGPDSAEDAIELESLDVLFAIDRESKVALRMITYAIERIDAGRYGLCGVCGCEIDAKRLSAIPYVDSCISCAPDGEAGL